jgi:EAL domain-containing protein (putative c-di-GMP-specific phosphodiesterase class I)
MEIGRLDHTTGRPAGSDTTELSDPLRLRAALDAGEFIAHFQPIIDLTSDEPTWFEALLRWEHPNTG